MNAPFKIGLGVGAVAIVAIATAWYENGSQYEHKGIKLLHNAAVAQPAARKSMDNVKPQFLKTQDFHLKTDSKADLTPQLNSSSQIAPSAPAPPPVESNSSPGYAQNSPPLSYGSAPKGRAGGYAPRTNPQNGESTDNRQDDGGPGGPPDGGPGGPGGFGGPPPDGGGGPGVGGPGGPQQSDFPGG